MQYDNAFSLVAQEFSKAHIPFVLIGGFAVNYYKVSRSTADVDFLIATNKVEEASEILLRHGYQHGNSGEPFRQFKSKDFRLMGVDLVLVDPQTFAGIIEEAVETSIAGEKLLLPSLEHLIALKLHAVKSNTRLRELKDLPDIISLVKINKVNVKSEKFRELCLDYGTQELYEKIVFHLRGVDE